MEKIKNHPISKFIYAIMAILMISPMNLFANRFHSENAAGANFSSQDYFNAVYFKKGPLAQQIYKGLENLTGKTSNDQLSSADRDQVQQAVMTAIEKNNPDYLNQFAAGIRSKNITEIEKTVKGGGELIYKTLLSLQHDPALKHNKGYQDLLKLTATQASPQSQACILYLVGFFAIAVYAAVYLWNSSSNAASVESAQLYKEKLIYNIYVANS